MGRGQRIATIRLQINATSSLTDHNQLTPEIRVSNQAIGEVKFVLLHHDGCKRGNFHYRIEPNGEVLRLAATSIRGQHPKSLGIVLTGKFDAEKPSDKQISALKSLLVDLKLRFPSVAVGAHRQVRGDSKTTCPGTKFPMTDLSQWTTNELIEIRDERIRADIESQYGP